METPPDTTTDAPGSWLNHIASPVLTNILLLILIAALGLDIALRSSPTPVQMRDQKLAVRLTPPPITIRTPGSVATKGIVNGPTTTSPTANMPSLSRSKKKFHDRVTPGP